METIYSYSLESLENLMLEMGEKKFRAKQIFMWLYRKRVTSFEEMTDIKVELQNKLKERFVIDPLTVREKQVSKDGTTKLLFELQDGSLIETVMMIYEFGKSVCVTSQVGCNMGCTFCASGLLKKKRDLSSGEMVAQIVYIQRMLDEVNERVANVVIMGTGEPFDNYDNVMEFLKTINDDLGIAIGARHLTVSTSGIVPRIIDFGKCGIQYNLAISLHAPNDELRNELMPINKAYPLKTLMAALREYSENSNRRITFEYILLKGKNDSPAHAEELAKLIRGMNAYVNLIPYNVVDEHGYKQVDRNGAMAFYNELMNRGIRATLRKEHGSDIDAACGQLRAKHARKE
ncbi:MAG: 23S rRNA (adenine(2503)-C(2))-methyltransferase RlmN [Erysipelotrichales bacterium]|nr:23S rRNA (adenine(2503)-C(2))-methyltransferase RlmN [Erysipelotrichales bacterium]